MKKIAGADMQAGGASQDAKQVALMPPMLIQGLRANQEDSESHLVLLNVEALILGLIADENAELSSSGSDASLAERGDMSPLTGNEHL